MGNGHSQKTIDGEKPTPSTAPAKSETINLKKYNKLGVIGRGGFGRVIFVKFRFGKFRVKKIKNCLR